MSKLKYAAERTDLSTDEDLDTEDPMDLIRCVCKDITDDGFTIQCEQCDTWQHAKCVNIKKKAIPEHYVCDRCRNLGKKRSPSALETKDRKQKPIQREKRTHNEESDEEVLRRKKFTSISRIVMKEKLVEDLFIEVHRQWIELNRPKSGNRKYKSESSSATTNKGLDSIVVMESNLLLPAIPKASVKPVQKLLRSSFSYRNDPSVQKGIFADIHIPENRYLMEVTGEALRKSEYKADTKNQFNLLGTPLPRVFFYPALDVCVDARYVGNDTRYIRRSCCPNSEIKSIILPNDNEDHTIHMGIYTKDDVDKGEEITIGWNWHKGHIMWKKNKEFKQIESKGSPDTMDEEEKKVVRETLDYIHHEFGKCACEDEEECLFEYLKEELERDEVPIPTSKKKKSKKPVTRVNDIFTSDEDEDIQIKGKNVQKQTPPTIEKLTKPSIPSLPIDSIIPPTTTSHSGIGSKRSRPIPDDSKLPCKKRWLNQYLNEQRNLTSNVETTIPHVAPTLSPKNTATELDPVYDEGDLSDEGSSQSTLPLDDTLTIPQTDEESNLTNDLSDEKLIGKEPIESINTTGLNNANQEGLNEMDTTTLPDSLVTLDDSTTIDEPALNETIINTELKKEEGTEELPVPKVKLSIQEYLNRQRGTLPTPDEKN